MLPRTIRGWPFSLYVEYSQRFAKITQVFLTWWSWKTTQISPRWWNPHDDHPRYKTRCSKRLKNSPWLGYCSWWYVCIYIYCIYKLCIYTYMYTYITYGFKGILITHRIAKPTGWFSPVMFLGLLTPLTIVIFTGWWFGTCFYVSIYCEW